MKKLLTNKEKEEAQSHFEIGENLLHDKKYDEALIYFDKAININPNLAPAYYSKAMAIEYFDIQPVKEDVCLP